MKKENRIEMDLSSFENSHPDIVRIPILFLKTQKFFEENEISEENRKVLARMLNAYYKD